MERETKCTVKIFLLFLAALVRPCDSTGDAQTCRFNVMVESSKCVVSSTLTLNNGDRHFDGTLCMQVTCFASMKKIEVMYCNPPFESPGNNCRVTFPHLQSGQKPSRIYQCCPGYTCTVQS
uniref:8.9 kDa family member n=1 Tax=Rhipicephalus appendiculatus TaxID=34631 RepID=A0A131YRV5_RHIAP